MSGPLRILTKPASLCNSISAQKNIVIPNIGQVRFKAVRIGKPRRPTWFRQRLLAVSQPVWDPPTPIEDIWQKCEHSDYMEEKRDWEKHINQLEKFYVKEMVELFEQSKMVGIFHTNPIKRNNFRIAWQNGRRIGMELRRYNYRIGVSGLAGTQWENCLHYWFSFPGDMNEQPLLFSPTLDPKKLLAYERKVPEFQLLACVVENRLLSRAQLVQMVTMPDLGQTRGELVAILGHHQQKLSQLLGANQQQLATNLTQLIKDKSGSSQEGGAS